MLNKQLCAVDQAQTGSLLNASHYILCAMYQTWGQILVNEYKYVFCKYTNTPVQIHFKYLVYEYFFYEYKYVFITFQILFKYFTNTLNTFKKLKQHYNHFLIYIFIWHIVHNCTQTIYNCLLLQAMNISFSKRKSDKLALSGLKTLSF